MFSNPPSQDLWIDQDLQPKPLALPPMDLQSWRALYSLSVSTVDQRLVEPTHRRLLIPLRLSEGKVNFIDEEAYTFLFLESSSSRLFSHFSSLRRSFSLL
eukprot:Blabericola_migrator_1__24@NODE_1006_length_5721_cov_24_862575_g414_i2_p7_GENE_NODE_1006_length_5721_cov_24_862575_g414_i2NODE_1006_length_5721_cov_24_862575_g414_i2_p7_ORF_typecomplete_len100_score6_85_NODE_1006_length_5721_cov_24_862575_g414_i240444343